MKKIKVITLKRDAYPGPIENLNRLAEAMNKKRGIKLSSVRGLAAELIHEGAAQRLAELESQSVKERIAS